jgi:hypothetical protein
MCIFVQIIVCPFVFFFCGLDISSESRRLRHHQSHSTDNSHQEAPFYEWEELKKTIPLFEDKEPELRTMDNKVTGEVYMKENEKQNLNLM